MSGQCPAFACEVLFPKVRNRFGDYPDFSYGCYFGDSNYSFSDQQKSFIKLQFKYMLTLKDHLMAGILPGYDVATGQVIPPWQGAGSDVPAPTPDQQQAYYDHNIWLAQQTLTSPNSAWWGEFTTAINEEDLQWLANQVGEDVSDIAQYLGRAAGTAAAGLINAAVKGLDAGLKAAVPKISAPSWLLILALGVGAYLYLSKTNPVSLARRFA